MKLSTLDRISILSILPKQGDILTLRIVRELESTIGFTEAEHKRLNFRTENGRIYWDEGVEPHDFTIGEVAQRIVRDSLIALERNKQLPLDHLSLYERFVEAKEPAPEPELVVAGAAN